MENLLNKDSVKRVQEFIKKFNHKFEVLVLDKEKKYYKFKWQVEKYKLDGPLKDCWLTTAVSQPMPMGSSI